MSNFENQKKQAKQILKWHRERHWPVAEQIRSALPHFHQMSDAEILDHTFQLVDAQAVIAARAGHSSWAALKEASREAGAPDAGRASEPHLSFAEPCLLASDIARTCDYFSSRLGFDVLFTYGDPPFYGVIERDDVKFSVRQVDQYIVDQRTARNEAEELFTAGVSTVAIEDVYQEYLDAGADFFQALRVEPWGRKSFVVRDPDGNLIAFHAA